MNKKITLLLLFMILLSASIQAQYTRTAMMGGLSLALKDKDNSLNLYDFGKNPAWLQVDEKSEWLDIVPSIGSISGDYRRQFSAEKVDYYSTGFTGVKPLGDAGVFRGSAIYSYELRKNYNRALTKDAYSGEAFFFTDTTNGNFRYNGPVFSFMYSLELADNLYMGAEVNYQILDGLKKVYTYAETMYRNVSGNIGLAYKLSENLAVGADFHIWNGQERILADDVNLRTVETKHYRGESRFIALNGTSQNYKIKKDGTKFGFQTSYSDNKFEAAVNADYMLCNSSFHFPTGNFMEAEDGYSSFEEFDVKAAGRYDVSESFTAGVIAGIDHNDCWSKYSPLEVTLWNWNTDDNYAGVGVAAKAFSLPLTVGLDYEIHQVKADSAKYIDKRENSIESMDHVIRTGAEYKFSNTLTLRAGFDLTNMEYDLVTGGKDVTLTAVTFGGSYSVSEMLLVELGGEYMTSGPSADSGLARNKWQAFAALRLFTF